MLGLFNAGHCHGKKAMLGIAVLFMGLACKPRSESSELLAPPGGAGGFGCGFADPLKAQTLDEARRQVAIDRFLADASTGEKMSLPERVRARFLLHTRSSSAGQANPQGACDRALEACNCTSSPEAEQKYLAEKTSLPETMDGISERIKTVASFEGGPEAALEEAIAFSQIVVRASLENNADVAIVAMNEVQQISAELEGKVSAPTAVPDLLTAGLALEVHAAAEAGDPAEASKVVEFGKRMLSGTDTATSFAFGNVSAKTKAAAAKLSQNFQPDAKTTANLQRFAAEGEAFKRIAMVHETFRSPADTQKLMEVTKKAPLMSRPRMLVAP